MPLEINHLVSLAHSSQGYRKLFVGIADYSHFIDLMMSSVVVELIYFIIQIIMLSQFYREDYWVNPWLMLIITIKIYTIERKKTTIVVLIRLRFLVVHNTYCLLLLQAPPDSWYLPVLLHYIIDIFLREALILQLQHNISNTPTS